MIYRIGKSKLRRPLNGLMLHSFQWSLDVIGMISTIRTGMRFPHLPRGAAGFIIIGTTCHVLLTMYYLQLVGFCMSQGLRVAYLCCSPVCSLCTGATAANGR